MAHTEAMDKLLRLHGYPSISIPINHADVFCESAIIDEAMDASEEDYGGQTQVCLKCGKAWDCGYGGSDRHINAVICPNLTK